MLFSLVPSNRRKDSGHRLKYIKLHLNTKIFFTVRVVRHWNRFPREAMGSPSLQILKSCLDTALSNLL